jgi:osmotically-inducible protein OsmY
VAKTDNQLTSEILKQLQNNLSDNQLKVLVKDGAVTISGTVVNQEQLQQIQPLLRSIQGIKSLNITATVL